MQLIPSSASKPACPNSLPQPPWSALTQCTPLVPWTSIAFYPDITDSVSSIFSARQQTASVYVTDCPLAPASELPHSRTGRRAAPALQFLLSDRRPQNYTALFGQHTPATVSPRKCTIWKSRPATSTAILIHGAPADSGPSRPGPISQLCTRFHAS
jgi:hypothetical protein